MQWRFLLSPARCHRFVLPIWSIEETRGAETHVQDSLPLEVALILALEFVAATSVSSPTTELDQEVCILPSNTVPRVGVPEGVGILLILVIALSLRLR